MKTVVDRQDAARAGRHYEWQVHHGVSGVARAAPAWRRVAYSGTRSVVADPAWTESQWGVFRDGDARLFVHVLSRSGRSLAVLPLRLSGGLLRRWSSVVQHAPYWLAALDDGDPDTGGEIVDHLLQSAALIDLAPIHAHHALCSQLVQTARARGHFVMLNDAGGDALIDLVRPWETFRRSLSRNLAETTGRHERQLRRLGTLAFDVVTAAGALEPVLAECFDVETLGWKATSGEPIKQHAHTLKFYTGLAQRAAAARCFALYTMRLDGHLLAWEYCLRGHGTIDMLKLSFDPAWARYSPGNVLRFWILQREIEAAEIDTYHLGQAVADHSAIGDHAQWKLRWVTRVEPLRRLRIYRRGVIPAIAYLAGPRLRRAARNRGTLHALYMFKMFKRACRRWARPG